MVSRTPFRAAEFKSNYGPNYQYQPNMFGMTNKQMFRLAAKLGAFGAAGGVALLLFASGIPRVKRDILQKVPFAGSLFVKEEPPASDNPF